MDADTVKWFEGNGGMTRENGDHFRQSLVVTRWRRLMPWYCSETSRDLIRTFSHCWNVAVWINSLRLN